jgi:hypothetical protein
MVEINGDHRRLAEYQSSGSTFMWTKIIVTNILGFCLCVSQDALAQCVNCEILKPPPAALGAEQVLPPQTFRLVCRGGDRGELRFHFTQATKTLFIGFLASTQPAPQGLTPGQCSWLDRGFRTHEPATICHHGINDFEVLWGDLADGTTTVSINSGQIRYLNNIRCPDAFVALNVFNEEGVCMRVISFEHVEDVWCHR